MSKFFRNSFYRTSANGVTHHVKGHTVERDIWDRSTNGYAGWQEEGLAELRKLGVVSTASARYVDPNATCPVCGERVYFYQNGFGSCVFFDEIGPPWPKHPCTASVSSPHAAADADASLLTDVQPAVRDDDDIEGIRERLLAAGIDHDFGYRKNHGFAPWKFAKVLKRIKGPEQVYLALLTIGQEGKRVYVSCVALPRSVGEQSVVSIGKGSISYFDLNSMEPHEVAIWRIPNAKTFIEEIAPVQ